MSTATRIRQSQAAVFGKTVALGSNVSLTLFTCRRNDNVARKYIYTRHSQHDQSITCMQIVFHIKLLLGEC